MLTVVQKRLQCPACEGTDLVLFCSAVVSPWVLELAGLKYQAVLKIQRCLKCATIFSQESYSEKILIALYKDYRGEEYLQIRQSWEPGYTRKLNSALNGSLEWMQLRQQMILNSLTSAGVLITEIDTCVDFGGGHGGVMPDFPNRYVFEENEAVRDSQTIKVVKNWDDVRTIKPDLVMCCGVLEHVNKPKDLVEMITKSGAKYFYFEVPAGSPTRRVGPFSNEYFLRVITKSKLAWRIIQRIERNLGKGTLRKFFPFRISEHLQFFSENGIKALMASCGLKVLNVSTQSHSMGLDGAKNMGFEKTIGVVVSASA